MHFLERVLFGRNPGDEGPACGRFQGQGYLGVIVSRSHLSRLHKKWRTVLQLQLIMVQLLSLHYGQNLLSLSMGYLAV